MNPGRAFESTLPSDSVADTIQDKLVQLREAVRSGNVNDADDLYGESWTLFRKLAKEHPDHSNLRAALRRIQQEIETLSEDNGLSSFVSHAVIEPPQDDQVLQDQEEDDIVALGLDSDEGRRFYAAKFTQEEGRRKTESVPRSQRRSEKTRRQ